VSRTLCEMKILYGVTGEGLGHTMRARTLAKHLKGRARTRWTMNRIS